MKDSRQLRGAGAALTALVLLAGAAPDALVLFEGVASHAHVHGATRGSQVGGWVQQTADHAPHEASQLEAAATVRHAECAVCTGRVRPHVSVLGLFASLSRQQARAALPLSAGPAVSTPEASPGQPRAPPIV